MYNFASVAPVGSPINILRTNNQKRSLKFQWNQPPCGTRNGNITSYSYRLDDPIRGTTVMDFLSHSNIGVTEVEIQELIPFVEYEFRVRAYTSVGPGPYSDPLKARTAEASKLFEIYIN